jgi:hypothetical protein
VSLTTRTPKECSLESIRKSFTEATLYTAFYYPKTQSEAVKLVYGIPDSKVNIFGEDYERVHKSTSNINITPITNARQKLINDGFLIKMDEKLRSSIFKASPLPITNYIKKQLKLRKSRINPNPSKDYEALSIILDSMWFRSFFSNDFLLNPPTHIPIRDPDFLIVEDDDYAPPSVYHPYGYISKKRMSQNVIHYSKIEVYDVVNLFSYLIEDIGAYSWGIIPVLNKIDGYSPLSSQEIIHSGDFDSIILKNQDTLPIDTILDFYSYCNEENDSLNWYAPTNPRPFIDKITIQSALIPLAVSEIMMRAGRIPLTLMYEIKNLQSIIYSIN